MTYRPWENGYNVCLIVMYTAVFVGCVYQVWKIIRAKHRKASFQFVRAVLESIWLAMRVLIWFATQQNAADWAEIFYLLPVSIQFADFSLWALYFALLSGSGSPRKVKVAYALANIVLLVANIIVIVFTVNPNASTAQIDFAVQLQRSFRTCVYTLLAAALWAFSWRFSRLTPKEFRTTLLPRTPKVLVWCVLMLGVVFAAHGLYGVLALVHVWMLPAFPPIHFSHLAFFFTLELLPVMITMYLAWKVPSAKRDATAKPVTDETRRRRGRRARRETVDSSDDLADPNGSAAQPFLDGRFEDLSVHHDATLRVFSESEDDFFDDLVTAPTAHLDANGHVIPFDPAGLQASNSNTGYESPLMGSLAVNGGPISSRTSASAAAAAATQISYEASHGSRRGTGFSDDHSLGYGSNGAIHTPNGDATATVPGASVHVIQGGGVVTRGRNKSEPGLMMIRSHSPPQSSVSSHNVSADAVNLGMGNRAAQHLPRASRSGAFSPAKVPLHISGGLSAQGMQEQLARWRQQQQQQQPAAASDHGKQSQSYTTQPREFDFSAYAPQSTHAARSVEAGGMATATGSGGAQPGGARRVIMDDSPPTRQRVHIRGSVDAAVQGHGAS